MRRLPAFALGFVITSQGMPCVHTAALADAAAKTPVRSLDDLPRYSYPYEGDVAKLIAAPALLTPIAARLGQDTRTTLSAYAITDRPTLRRLHGVLMRIDMWKRDYPAAQREIGLARALADKPADKLTLGLDVSAYVAAAGKAAPGTAAFGSAFRKAYAAELATLPWSVVGEEIKQRESWAEVMSAAVLTGYVAQDIQPEVTKGGVITQTTAPFVIQAALTLRDFIPLKAELTAAASAYIAANDRPKPDIWSARAAVFPAGAKLTPVVVAIWDEGTDASVFPGKLWSDPAARAPDGHPVHGIGADVNGRPTQDLLLPVPPEIAPDLDHVRAMEQGSIDQQVGIRSAEAKAYLAYVSRLTPAEAQRDDNEDAFYGDYAHGTHVAGIVAAGNPAVRMMIVRHSFDWRSPPRRPTLATATAMAQSYQDAIAYMKKAGVRVVNMSWTVDIKTEYEDQLAANGVPENERVSEARHLFGIEAKGLRDALLSAPGILFVCAAGNQNDNAAFTASVPASIDAPNVLTVAAVDQAGDATSFTSTGPTVRIAADGYRIESFLPGGTKARWSGTSMASPAIVNTAAKLLAVNPKINAVELRTLLLATGTRTAAGILLVNPAGAMAEAEARIGR